MITWSYIAGFLDADGWIGITYLKSGRPVYLAGLTQVILEKKSMEKIHKFLIDKGIKAKFKIRKKENWKSSLKMINITVKEQNSLFVFLKKIQPHLLIKLNLAKEASGYLEKRIKIRNLKPKKSSNEKIRWSKSDYKLLENFVKMGWSNVQISHRMNRGTQAVANKVSRLGLKRGLTYDERSVFYPSSSK